MKRRELIKYFSVVPLAGGVAGLSLQPVSASPVPSPAKRDIFKELGVRTFINAAGTYTAMTGSLMHDFVLETIYNSSGDFCMMDELQDKVGEQIALLVHSQAAVVTSGAFSGATAAFGRHWHGIRSDYPESA
jgi:hypothetical protein